MKTIAATVLLTVVFTSGHSQGNTLPPGTPAPPSQPAQPVQPVQPGQTPRQPNQPRQPGPPGPSIPGMAGTNFPTGTNFYLNTNRLNRATNSGLVSPNPNVPGGRPGQPLTNLEPGMLERPAWATNVRAFWFTNYPAGTVFPTNPVPPALTNITYQTDPDLWLSNWWWFSTNAGAMRLNRAR